MNEPSREDRPTLIDDLRGVPAKEMIRRERLERESPRGREGARGLVEGFRSA
jgi:hypothetical protein